MDGHDAHTSYSDSSAILSQEVADKYVIAICNSINEGLEGSFDARALMSSSGRLSALIKAFAVKLGSDTVDQLNLRAMHFIHEHHQYIVSQLRNKFQNDESDAVDPRRSIDTIPLDEKMGLWAKTQDQDPAKLDSSEYFQGVRDDAEIEGDEGGANEEGYDLAFSGYEKTIVKSAAYKWLISSLVKEASFHWDEAQPRSMVDQIRHGILSRLPARRISPRRPPDCHTVLFKIPKSSLPFLLERQQTQSTTNSPAMIADRIVVISTSADSIQVCKVSQYMDQTWPLGGKKVLSVLQTLANGKGQARTSSNKPEIEVVLKGFYLEALVTGTSYSIAEYGEQLAWLAAALQPTVSALPIWVIEIWRDAIDDADITALAVLEWQGELRSPVIVRGFPIMSRPETCPGFEVLPHLLVGLLSNILRGKHEERFKLSTTTGRLLELFEQTKGIMVWHILRSPEEVCTCRKRSLKDDDNSLLPFIGSVEIWQHRHIITNCPTAKLRHGDTIPLIEPGSGSTEISQRECSPPEAAQLTPYSEDTTDSLDSVDIDMLSIPDFSENGVDEPSDTDDAALAIVEQIATRLVSKYRQNTKRHLPANECHSNAKQCSPGGQQSVTTHGSSQSTLRPAATQAVSAQLVRKRPVEQDDSDGDEESQRRPTQKKPKKSHPRQGLRLLACPFWKQNPGKHSKCFGKKLNMISRVKQHLTRCHYPEFYCEKCLSVFPDEESKQMHLRATPSLCEWKSGPLQGITHLQHRKLSRKPVKGSTEPQQWFAVWDIVFPNIDRPSSPYIDPDLSQDLYQYHEFCERQGPRVFIEAFQNEGLVEPGDIEREALFRRGVTRGLRMLPDQWRIYRAATSQTSASEVSSTAASNEEQYDERQHAQVPTFGDQSSNADSGIDLRSQPSSGLARESANPSPYPLIRPRPPSDVSVNSGLPATTDLSTHAASFSSNGANTSQVSVDLPPTDVGSLDVLTQDEANHLTSVLANSDSGAECPDNGSSDLTWNHFLEDFDFSSFQSS
ncbi:hypothetical protein E8E14_003931 [Neopestalotiopsis sp. 37M]|nr:hypothetical protein E8E14_003931 [Neopestalotiopsis sp. 37M]